MSMLRYILLVIFSAVSIEKSLGQDSISKPIDVQIYFQSVAYSIPQLNIVSSVVIYDTYYHKIDSVAVPKEGVYLDLPKIDLIFKVRTNEVGYRQKGEVFYAEELKDSIKIVIYSKGTSGGHIIVRPIFFSQNSYVLDSVALNNLKEIKRILLLMDDSTHRLNVEVHSKIDVLEKSKDSELLKSRARVVKEVLMKNNGMNFTLFVTNDTYFQIAKPKTEKEHAFNRCVCFKMGRVNCDDKDLNIKVE